MVGRHIVLIGMMGSGKTTLGAALARRIGRPFVDVDEELVARLGCSIPEFFDRAGEPAFRQIEADTIAEILAQRTPAVVGAGGGAVLHAGTRALLGEAAQVVWLQAPAEVLAQRVGSGDGRPMLAGANLIERIRDLSAQRAGAYDAAAQHRLDVSTGLVEQLVERLAGQLGIDRGPLTVTRVNLAERNYDVVVGPGAVHELAGLLPSGTRKVAIVTQAAIPVTIELAQECRTFLIGDGEPAKCLATVEDLCRRFAQWGLNRGDAVVAVGGGVVTDVAGFAAAVYHRGVPVIHVATTLLGQIDAAIGGKTGVNLPEGKNLVGAFWQPAAVVCDTDVLTTLPEREYRAGLGELAKYHFLGGGELDRLTLAERVTASVRIKAAVVSGDERESGRRAILNYGHTLAHALEIAGEHDLRHGEAVAIGLVYAAELGLRRERIDAARVAEHRRVVAAYGLPAVLPPEADLDRLVDLMSRDKKAIHGLTFVLDGPQGVEVVNDVTRADLDAAFAACR